MAKDTPWVRVHTHAIGTAIRVEIPTATRMPMGSGRLKWSRISAEV